MLFFLFFNFKWRYNSSCYIFWAILQSSAEGKTKTKYSMKQIQSWVNNSISIYRSAWTIFFNIFSIWDKVCLRVVGRVWHRVLRAYPAAEGDSTLVPFNPSGRWQRCATTPTHIYTIDFTSSQNNIIHLRTLAMQQYYIYIYTCN